MMNDDDSLEGGIFGRGAGVLGRVQPQTPNPMKKIACADVEDRGRCKSFESFSVLWMVDMWYRLFSGDHISSHNSCGVAKG